MRITVFLLLVSIVAGSAPVVDNIYDTMPAGVVPIYVHYNPVTIPMNATVDWVGMSPSGSKATIVSGGEVHSYDILSGSFDIIDKNTSLASITNYKVKSDVSGSTIYYGNGLYLNGYSHPLLDGQIGGVSTSAVGFIACNSTTVLSATFLNDPLKKKLEYKPSISTCKSLWVNRDHNMIVTVNGRNDSIYFEQRNSNSDNWVHTKKISGFGIGVYVTGSFNNSLISLITTTGSTVVIDNNSTAALSAAVASTVSDIAVGPEFSQSVYPFQVLAYKNSSGMFVHALNTTGDFWYSTWGIANYIPSAFEFSWDAHTAVTCTGASSEFQILQGCVADITFKKYNIPHNGYASRLNTTLHECIDLCCNDEQCRLFQWIPADEPRGKYPDENCLLFLESEKHFVLDYKQPFHTYVMRKSSPAPEVPISSHDDSEGMTIVPLIVAFIVLLIGCIIFFMFISKRKFSGGNREAAPKNYSVNKNNRQSEIDKSLLANEVSQHEVEMEEEPQEENNVAKEDKESPKKVTTPEPESEPQEKEKAEEAKTDEPDASEKEENSPPAKEDDSPPAKEEKSKTASKKK